eukprot:SAG25_NODE_390_length_8662_cov_4.211141_1_plen_48_part_10
MPSEAHTRTTRTHTHAARGAGHVRWCRTDKTVLSTDKTALGGSLRRCG